MDAVGVADAANGSSAVLRTFTKRNPAEPVQYSAAAILLPAWSHNGQVSARVVLGTRRGTLLVTSDRLYFSSGTLSPMTFFWLAVVLVCVGVGLLTRNPLLVLAGIAPVLMIWQRVPVTREILWDEVSAIEVRTIPAEIAPAYSIAIRTGQDAMRFNTNKPVSDELCAAWASRANESD